MSLFLSSSGEPTVGSALIFVCEGECPRAVSPKFLLTSEETPGVDLAESVTGRLRAPPAERHLGNNLPLVLGNCSKLGVPGGVTYQRALGSGESTPERPVPGLPGGVPYVATTTPDSLSLYICHRLFLRSFLFLTSVYSRNHIDRARLREFFAADSVSKIRTVKGTSDFSYIYNNNKQGRH